MAMDTDSNADEEGADESRDGQDGPSPGRTYEDAAVNCASVRAASAPCSPSGARPGPGCGPGSALDCVSLQKAGERPSSLPPSSPRALAHNDWAYHSAVCPAERQHPGMQRDKGIHTARHSITERSNIVSCASFMLSFALDLTAGWVTWLLTVEVPYFMCARHTVAGENNFQDFPMYPAVRSEVVCWLLCTSYSGLMNSAKNPHERTFSCISF